MMFFAGYRNNNILNKILFSLLIIIFVFMCILPICFSSSDTINCYISASKRNVDIILPSGFGTDYNYYFIYSQPSSSNNSKITLGFYLCTKPFYISENESGSLHFYTSSDGFLYKKSFYIDKYGSYDFSSYNLSSFGNPFKSFDVSFATGTVYDYSNFDIYTNENKTELFFKGTIDFLNPSFITTQEDLQSGKFDILKIDAGDLDYSEDNFVLNIYDMYDLGEGVYSEYIKKSFLLSSKSDYNYYDSNSFNRYYHIPKEKLGIDISNGKRYKFELKEKGGDTIYSSVTFQISGLTSDEEIKNSQDVTNDKLDEQNNKLDEQTNAIKESNETNKGIWETIKDILSYINPFSENFFVYKLIELLVDAIKSLFIPSDDFFGNYFTDLKEWFSDRLGFLFYPFELIIDILTKILSINFSEPIFNVPNISEPFTGHKIINAITFNLNSLLENNIFNTVHSIYFICVDAFITFKLVNLFKRKYEEVTEK